LPGCLAGGSGRKFAVLDCYRGRTMKAIVYSVLLGGLAVALVLPLTENSVFAQAPTGPQGGAPPPAQQQQNPDSPKATNPAQQAPQAGVTIAVDVPIVTLDVVATTQRGDI